MPVSKNPGESPDDSPKKKHLKEKLFLAAQASQGALRAVPGDMWALHYPKEGAVRREKLEGLLSGKYKPGDIDVKDLQPDALLYNIEDLDEKGGLEKVVGRIRDISARVATYDHKRFAEFVAELAGTKVDVDTAEALYDGLRNSRLRKGIIDSYGATGRQQMKTALQSEVTRTLSALSGLPRVNRVLEALKLDWLCEDFNYVDEESRDRAVASLSGDERELFNKLRDFYRKYVNEGREEDYRELVDEIKKNLEKITEQPKTDQPSESMEKLEEELKKYQDQVGPPGTPQDPAIPPDDEDEYNTSEPQPGEGKQEKMKSQPFFEITPSGTSTVPFRGSYCSGRKSYFDIDRKTWSKKKRLTPYTTPLGGGERQTISGSVDGGVKSIPIPARHALDFSSLKYSGAAPKIYRDQNGCFYIETDSACSFSIDFLKENPPHENPPIMEDTQSIYRGGLSAPTEAVIKRMNGTNIQKAEQARQYLLANHFYPGGGDLKKAQALQHKLRSESTGDNYVQNLDKSEYLECYSANTLFIAMLRKAGIPARLVVGHRVQGAKNGKAEITDSTGHAWAEIWDGSGWRRFDATPAPKPEDKKKTEEGEKEKQEESTPSQEADDGGVESSQSSEGSDQQGQQGDIAKDVADKVQKKVDSMKDQQQPPGDATDSQMQDAEQDLKETADKMEEMEAKKQDAAEKIKDASSAKDLKDVKDKIDKDEDLLDEMKKDLKEKMEAKEKQLKDEMKEKIDKMAEDGFIDEEKKKQIQDGIDNADLAELEELQRQMDEESRAYDQYDAIREEVMPLVEHWYRYFAELLPREHEIDADEDSLSRQGKLNRRAVQKPRNLMFGTVKNPRVFRPSVKPRFLASIVLDVSGSMEGEKLENARKLLVFYSELFSRISKEFGYIRFSIHIFSDSVQQIKGFGQDYDSSERYDFGAGQSSTIKVRLMKALRTQGGTNMLSAIRMAAGGMNAEVFEYPDYLSALYFMGDGGDTCGNAHNVKAFLQNNDAESGFGRHMKSAVLLGSEGEKAVLAEIFGEENTSVAPDFDSLVGESMIKFANDVTQYTKNLTT